MSYDEQHQRVVLFGGSQDNGLMSNDTWTWDGTDWFLVNVVVSPPARTLSAMAYDKARAEVVLFGGYSSGQPLDDTWVWDGSTWTPKHPIHSPNARYVHSMAYDAMHGQVVLFGGASTSASVSGETWTWDGTDWTQQFPSHSPLPRYESAMAYDALRNETVLFGGFPAASANMLFNDTWVWDGTDWSERTTANRPPPTAAHAMTYDSNRGEILLIGGEAIEDLSQGDFYSDATWRWDGTTWFQTSGLDVNGRLWPAIAYDAQREELALFGGLVPFANQDTGTWIRRIPLTTGSISITTNLSAATFTVSGPATFSGSGQSFTQADLPSGTYTITYGPVNCFTAPPPETRTLIAGQVLAFTPAQYSGNATLSIAVSPVSAGNAPFSITPAIQGAPSSGPYPVVLAPVFPTTYTITFGAVVGLVAPSPITASPDPSCRIDVIGIYGTATDHVIEVSVNNGKGDSSLFDSSGTVIAKVVNGRTLVKRVSAGTYTVHFGDIDGYFTPSDQIINLQPSAEPRSTAIRGTYRKFAIVSFTGFFNAPATGVRYKENELNDPERGMTRVLWNLSQHSELRWVSRAAFTFFTKGDGGGERSAPSVYLDHAEAEKYLAALKLSNDDRVMVIGHSYGAHRARLFVEQIRRNLGLVVDLLMTVDPVDWDTCYMTAAVFRIAQCDQSDDSWAQPTSAKNGHGYKGTIGFFNPFTLAFTQLLGYGLRPPALTLALPVEHDRIDDAEVVQSAIVDNAVALSIDSSLLAVTIAKPYTTGTVNLPLRFIATGTAAVSTPTITQARMNGVLASEIQQISNTDIQPGNSSELITIRFPLAAGAATKASWLSISGVASGTPFSFEYNIAPF